MSLEVGIDPGCLQSVHILLLLHLDHVLVDIPRNITLDCLVFVVESAMVTVDHLISLVLPLHEYNIFSSRNFNSEYVRLDDVVLTTNVALLVVVDVYLPFVQNQVPQHSLHCTAEIGGAKGGFTSLSMAIRSHNTQ